MSDDASEVAKLATHLKAHHVEHRGEEAYLFLAYPANIKNASFRKRAQPRGGRGHKLQAAKNRDKRQKKRKDRPASTTTDRWESRQIHRKRDGDAHQRVCSHSETAFGERRDHRVPEESRLRWVRRVNVCEDNRSHHPGRAMSKRLERGIFPSCSVTCTEGGVRTARRWDRHQK